MKQYMIFKIENDFYMGYSENGERKLLGPDRTSYSLNYTFNNKINKMTVHNNKLILYYDDFDVTIDEYIDFFNKYPELEFVQRIINYQKKQNLSQTSNRKVKRENKYVEEKVGAFILAGITLASVLVIHNDSNKETASHNNETTSPYSISETTTLTQTETLAPSKTTQAPTTQPLQKEKTTETITVESTTKIPIETTTKETTTKETTTEKEVVESNVKTLSGYNYKNKIEEGFVVTTGNQTYNISQSDFDLMCATVMAEGGSNPNEALAVSSVILNRCDVGGWWGSTVRGVITSNGQFEVYEKGYYYKYLNGNVPDTVKMAVRDALNGVRNCKYTSFRGYSSYSPYNITDQNYYGYAK